MAVARAGGLIAALAARRCPPDPSDAQKRPVIALIGPEPRQQARLASRLSVSRLRGSLRKAGHSRRNCVRGQDGAFVQKGGGGGGS